MLHKQYTSWLLLTVYVYFNSYLVCYYVLDVCRLETWFLFTIHIEVVNNKLPFHSLTSSLKVLCPLRAVKLKLPLWMRDAATCSVMLRLAFALTPVLLKRLVQAMIGVVD